MEEKTSFEKFKEWEKSAPRGFLQKYMAPPEVGKTALGKIDLEKYAEGMNLLQKRFIEEH